MTSMLTRIPPKTLVVVAVVLPGAALVAGFALDVKACGEHLLAELVGLLANVLIAVRARHAPIEVLAA